MKKFLFIVSILVLTEAFSMAQNMQKTSDGFVFIKGGNFLMGSPASERMRDADEAQHNASVADFWCDPYEVRQKDFEAVMKNNPSFFKGEDLPVESVSWFDALEYCNKKSVLEKLEPCYKISNGGKTVRWNRVANGYRLLTEAEWEYAHRAGTATAFYTQNYTTASQANFYGCYPYLIEENYLNHTNKDVVTGDVRDRTVRVDEFSPNAFGLYNTAGNVAEWCFDVYGAYSESVENCGAKNGYLRVARGGGYNDFGKHLRSAYRSCYEAGTVDRKRGFRICRNANSGGVSSSSKIFETNDNADFSTSLEMTKDGKVKKSRAVVVYFSYSGNTKKAAKMIAEKLGCEAIEIQMAHPYRGNIYDVSQKDLMALSFPALKNGDGGKIDLSKYDAVFLGYPTWWATMPRPVATFVSKNDFGGKLVLPFSSHGGTRFGESVSDLAKIAKGARVQNAFEFNYSGGRDLEKRIDEWLGTVISE